MKKIVILYPAHYEQIMGGAEMQIKYFMQACRQLGHEVHYIYEDKGKVIKNEEGIILHPMSKIPKIKFCGKVWFLYKKGINKFLNEIKPDVIYTRLASSWIYFAAKYAEKQQINHLHCVASDKSLELTLNIFSYPICSLIENYYINKGLRKATNIVVQNKCQHFMLQKRFNRIGIKINQMTEIFDATRLVKNDNVLTIVWIANFKKIKQPELFVELAQKLSSYSSQIRMVMCGRFVAGYESLLKKINSIEYLEYRGELKQEEVFDLLKESDILVNTSEFEGFSNTFVQAWMRKNIVFSLNSNPDDILTNYNVGYLLPSIDLMKDKIIEILADRENLHSMQNEAYSYVMQNHSIDNCMFKFEELL